MNPLKGFEWFPKCPDGHRWYACAHEELALPEIGIGMILVGSISIIVGLTEVL